MNKQQLQQEIEALQKQLEEKQKALAAMPEKWEPKGGWCIDVGGDILTCDEGLFADFGNCFRSYEQAEKAAKAMRAHNRLLAYVAEFAPDWCADWDDATQRKSAVAFTGERCEYWDYVTARPLGAVIMPTQLAKELCRKLNTGEVEL